MTGFRAIRLMLCKVRAQMKNPHWPIELKQPIIIDDVVKSIPTPTRFNEEWDIEVLNALSEERDRRLEIISQFLGTEVPANYEEWLEFLDAICRHWNIPAFRVEQSKPRGPGATRIWTDQKLCELFADVQGLVKGGMTENGACKFIAQNPHQFGPRYLRSKGTIFEAKTLHRQFVNAKDKIKNNHLFRTVHFSGFGSHRPVPEFGPEFKDLAIKQYAYARNLSKPNSA